MSIIPTIKRPTIVPNVLEEIGFSGSLSVGLHVVRYGVGDFIRMYWSDHYGVTTINVAGTLWAATTEGVSAAIAGMYIQNIAVSGVVAAEAAAANSEYGQGNATAITVGGQGASVSNTGTIYAATDVGIAKAIDHWGTGVVISNAGLIAVRTGGAVVDNGATTRSPFTTVGISTIRRPARSWPKVSMRRRSSLAAGTCIRRQTARPRSSTTA